MNSRNVREGRYAGKLYGDHWRSRHYRRPGDYTAAIGPFVAMLRAADQVPPAVRKRAVREALREAR